MSSTSKQPPAILLTPASSFVRFLRPLTSPSSSAASNSKRTNSNEGTVHDYVDTDSGEEWLWSLQGVGLYMGNSRMPDHQTLSLHLTSHRLIFLQLTSASPYSSLNATPVASTSASTIPGPNLEITLADVRQTEHYLGFMKSSPKVTLYLGPSRKEPPFPFGSPPTAASASTSISTAATSSASPSDPRSWTCKVCGFVNALPSPQGTSRGDHLPAQSCKLCGMKQDPAVVITNPSPSPVDPTGRRVDIPSPVPQPVSKVPPSLPPKDSFEIPCPRCTFLNHPALHRCEICGAEVSRHQSNGRPTRMDSPIGSGTGTTIGSRAGTGVPESRSSTPQPHTHNQGGSLWLGMNTLSSAVNPAAEDEEMEILRISFRKGGDKEFYRRLKLVLSKKAWERQSAKVPPSASNAQAARTASGIDGILQTMSLEQKTTESNVQDAFQDLEALMLKAGEMVKLVTQMNAKLTAQEEAKKRSNADGAVAAGDSVAKEDESFIRSSLVQMGLPSPAVTADMAENEQEYLRELARELGRLLTGANAEAGLMTGENGRGLVGLDEAWGIWNRVRGISLISPETMRNALAHLPQYTRPSVRLLALPSGTSVLHTPIYSPQAIDARIRKSLQPHSDDEQEKSVSTVDFAMNEGLAVGIAAEILGVLSSRFGTLAVDSQASETGGDRWYRNIILDARLSTS